MSNELFFSEIGRILFPNNSTLTEIDQSRTLPVSEYVNEIKKLKHLSDFLTKIAPHSILDIEEMIKEDDHNINENQFLKSKIMNLFEIIIRNESEVDNDNLFDTDTEGCNNDFMEYLDLKYENELYKNEIRKIYQIVCQTEIKEIDKWNLINLENQIQLLKRDDYKRKQEDKSLEILEKTKTALNLSDFNEIPEAVRNLKGDTSISYLRFADIKTKNEEYLKDKFLSKRIRKMCPNLNDFEIINFVHYNNILANEIREKAGFEKSDEDIINFITISKEKGQKENIANDLTFKEKLIKLLEERNGSINNSRKEDVFDSSNEYQVENNIINEINHCYNEIDIQKINYNILECNLKTILKILYSIKDESIDISAVSFAEVEEDIKNLRKFLDIIIESESDDVNGLQLSIKDCLFKLKGLIYQVKEIIPMKEKEIRNLRTALTKSLKGAKMLTDSLSLVYRGE